MKNIILPGTIMAAVALGVFAGCGGDDDDDNSSSSSSSSSGSTSSSSSSGATSSSSSGGTSSSGDTDAGETDAGDTDAATACAAAGGSCVAVVPGSCENGTISADSCGGGVGTACCIPTDGGIL